MDNGSRQKERDNSQFQFNANWIFEESFEMCINGFWESSRLGVLMKLKELGIELSKWVREDQRHRKLKVDELNSRLEMLVSTDSNEDNLMNLIGVKLALNIKADKEELFWE